jgi:hypothetical protein
MIFKIFENISIIVNVIFILTIITRKLLIVNIKYEFRLNNKYKFKENILIVFLYY